MAGRRAWGCSRWREGCGFTLPFAVAGHTLTSEDLGALVSRGRTEALDALESSRGGRRPGYLSLERSDSEAGGFSLRPRPLSKADEVPPTAPGHGAAAALPPAKVWRGERPQAPEVTEGPRAEEAPPPEEPPPPDEPPPWYDGD